MFGTRRRREQCGAVLWTASASSAAGGSAIAVAPNHAVALLLPFSPCTNPINKPTKPCWRSKERAGSSARRNGPRCRSIRRFVADGSGATSSRTQPVSALILSFWSASSKRSMSAVPTGGVTSVPRSAIAVVRCITSTSSFGCRKIITSAPNAANCPRNGDPTLCAHLSLSTRA